MRKLLLLFFVSTCWGSVAQPPDFQDLIILYADGKYDKCIAKCEKYEGKEDTKKNPIPYLYKAKSFFEISKDQSWLQKNDVYKRAYSQALRYAATYRKKDKAGAYVKDNWEFLEELKGAVMNDVDMYMHAEKLNYRKASSELKRLVTFCPEDAGAWLLKGVSDYRNRVKADAKMAFKKANELLENVNFKDDVMRLAVGDELSEIDNWKQAVEDRPSARTLMNGLMEAAKLYQDLKQFDKAKAFINKGFPWFEKHEGYKALYDEIVNG